jgi:thymidylate kinase
MNPADPPLVERVPIEGLLQSGLPPPEVARDRERAAQLAADALSDLIRPGGIRTSPLGPAWSRDIDVHVTAEPDPYRLRRLGWLCLDPLLTRLGIGGHGRWAVVEEGRVLAAADLHRNPPPDPVTAVLRRCRRLGQVRLREVLELESLVRSGHTLPAAERAVRLAARAEASLGGNQLARYADGPPLSLPAPLGPFRRPAFRRPRLRRVRLTIAVSGVDGSGKSTLSGSLARDFQRLGIPTSMVWTRPGMQIGILEPLAQRVKQLLGQDSRAGLRHMARGAEPHALRSRRGLIGWAWAMLVTLSFLSQARRGYRRGRGMVIYDRHLLDALVTLDLAYQGVGLRMHRALVRRFLPRAARTFYLDLPAEVAAARKPDPIFDEPMIRRELHAYTARLPDAPHVHRLDATHPSEQLVMESIRVLLEA